MTVPSTQICRLFLFDLDGTLVDSAADIAQSINLALARAGIPALAPERIGDFVGNGVHNLVRRSLTEALEHEPGLEQVSRVTSIYLEEYGNHLLDFTRLYPGVRELLDTLWWGRFGVVTNKPEGFSRRILEGLGIGTRFSVILGGDSTTRRKPHPEPLLEAMERCGAKPSETVMIGDSALDIAAGKAAGCMTLGVTGGFRPRTELEAAGCDFLVQAVAEAARYFRQPADCLISPA